MKLIIAEKPSLGKNIVNAIGAHKFRSFDGYLEGPEYIVTWGFGHLFSLYGIEDYQAVSTDEKPVWTLDGLPFCPDKFQFALRKKAGANIPDPGIRKQFETIRKLCSRPDVEYIISSGDADREGEIIIRIILDYARNKKPVKRLWLPEQTSESIRAALSQLRPDSDYDNLAREGYARTYIDWLYGINLTRLATIKAKSLLRVGRVIVPIVKAIYDRDMLIRNFVPEPYLALVSKKETNGCVITLTSKKTFSAADRAAAEAFANQLNSIPAIVSDVQSERKEIHAGKLFSLSKLQGVLGKKFKMTPKESLEIVQKLYESGYVTYPRTNTEYLAKAEAGRINAILAKLQKAGYCVVSKDEKKSIYDDSKIESHSALTPTLKIPSDQDLSAKEQTVYRTIFNRFLAVFCSNPCTVNRTTISIDVGNIERFKLTGDIFLTKGWMEYEDSDRNDKVLPSLNVGDLVTTNFQLIEKKTSPPKHYTTDTLTNFLKNPFRKEKLSVREEDTDSETTGDESAENAAEEEAQYKAIFEGVELGTEATRTAIIENAIHSGYIMLKNDTYTIQPGGIFYVETLQKLGIALSKEKTAEIGRVLKRVYHGEMDIEQSVAVAYKEIQEMFAGANGISVEANANLPADTVGKCPICGNLVRENAKAFSCSGRDCYVVFFKNDKLLASISKRMSASIVKKLLEKGSVPLNNCKSLKTNKVFDCILTVSFDDGSPELDIEFPDPADNAVGTCPKCGGLVIPDRFGNFTCSNRQRGCTYKIYGMLCGKKLSKSTVRVLLSKGVSGELKGFKSAKTGKSFNAKLALDEEGKVSFIFSDRRKN